MGVRYLNPGDSIDHERLNDLYWVLDELAATALSGRSPLWLRSATLAGTDFLHRQFMGRRFVFTNGPRLFTKQIGLTSYDHAVFTAAAAAAVEAEPSDGSGNPSRDLEREWIYCNCTADLHQSLEVMKKEGLYIVQNGKVPLLPQRELKQVQAELIFEGSGLESFDFPAAWDKYRFFRIHNCNTAEMTVRFLDEEGEEEHLVVVPEMSCRCVRRSGGSYTDGFRYFHRYLPGDPRSYFSVDEANAGWFGLAGGSPIGLHNANNVWNFSAAVSFLAYAVLGQSVGGVSFAPVGCLDLRELPGHRYPGMYGDPESVATFLGDLLHHRGRVKKVTVDEATQESSSEDIEFEGYESLVAKMSQAGILATTMVDGVLYSVVNPEAGKRIYLCGETSNLLCDQPQTWFDPRTGVASASGGPQNYKSVVDLSNPVRSYLSFNPTEFPQRALVAEAAAQATYREVIYTDGVPSLGATVTKSVSRKTTSFEVYNPWGNLYHSKTVGWVRTGLPGVEIRLTSLGPRLACEVGLELQGALPGLDPRWYEVTAGAAGVRHRYRAVAQGGGYPVWGDFWCEGVETGVRQAHLAHLPPRAGRIYMDASAEDWGHPSFGEHWWDGGGADGALKVPGTPLRSTIRVVRPVRFIAWTAGMTGKFCRVWMEPRIQNPDPSLGAVMGIGATDHWYKWGSLFVQNQAPGGLENFATDPDAMLHGAGMKVIPGNYADDFYRMVKLRLDVEHYNLVAGLVNGVTRVKPLNFVDHFYHPDWGMSYAPAAPHLQQKMGLTGLSDLPAGCVVAPGEQFCAGLVGQPWWIGNWESGHWTAIGVPTRTVADFPASWALAVAATRRVRTWTIRNPVVTQDVQRIDNTHAGAPVPIWNAETTYAGNVGLQVVCLDELGFFGASRLNDNRGIRPVRGVRTAYWEASPDAYLGAYVGGWRTIAIDPATFEWSAADQELATAVRTDLTPAAVNYRWVKVADVKAAAEGLGYVLLHGDVGVPMKLAVVEVGGMDGAWAVGEPEWDVSGTGSPLGPPETYGISPNYNPVVIVGLETPFPRLENGEPVWDSVAGSRWQKVFGTVAADARFVRFVPWETGEFRLVDPAGRYAVRRAVERDEISQLMSCAAPLGNYFVVLALDDEEAEAWAQVNYDKFYGSAIDDRKSAVYGGSRLLGERVQVRDHSGLPVAHGLVMNPWPWFEFQLPWSVSAETAQAKAAFGLATVTPVVEHGAVYQSAPVVGLALGEGPWTVNAETAADGGAFGGYALQVVWGWWQSYTTGTPEHPDKSWWDYVTEDDYPPTNG